MADDNIFNIVQGGKTGETPEQSLPEADYEITLLSGNRYYARGFLIFTTHHVAVMRDVAGLGAVPVLIVPLANLEAAEAMDDDEEETVPF